MTVNVGLPDLLVMLYIFFGFGFMTGVMIRQWYFFKRAHLWEKIFGVFMLAFVFPAVAALMIIGNIKGEPRGEEYL
jgi:ABC-type arginine transport system permease subunit